MRHSSSRLVLITLLASLLWPGTLPVFAFSDVSSQTSYQEAIDALEGNGVIEGYTDGTFKPLSTINRAEFLKIVLEGRAKGQTFSGSDCFPDVMDQWFALYVCTAKKEGIVSGYPDGTFKPEQTITFVEASKIVTLAFKQTVSDNGSDDWFEPFVRALESSKAIPPSISGFDRPINRGEMAEIMWRLSEGKTDQPSIGVLNVKYPEMTVNMASDVPQQAKSCADLRALAEQAQLSGGGYIGMTREKAIAPMLQGTTTAAETTADDGDYSQTNVQVAGVDEGDIVKTDGKYLYMISGGNIVRIVKALPATSLALASTIRFDDDSFSPTDLYIDHDILTIIGRKSGSPVRIMEKSVMPVVWPYPYYVNRTEARLYDVSNPAAPVLKRRVTLDGSLTSSRRIGDSLYLVLNTPMTIREPIPLLKTEESSLMPRFEDTSVSSAEQPMARCGNVVILPHIPSPQYLTVATIPLTNTSKEVSREVIVGNAQDVYASLSNLYVAQTEWNYQWNYAEPATENTQKTSIYRFRFDDSGVAFEAKGSVPGHILNQFSMDESDDTFRIATTKGEVWNETNPSTNNLYILSMDMETIGSIEDIAPGEQIYSVRFMGDRAYMVTFKKIDPFFVIGLEDPRHPTILGKLKIPGFSDYLHPYDATHIIGFGKEAEDTKEGSFAWYQGMKIAVFDVTDVGNPKEMYREVIGDRGTSSPLLTNHKALLFDKERGLISFPVTVYQIPAGQKESGEPSAYGSPIFQGAYVYNFTLADGFELLGTITHYASDTFLKAGDYWYSGDKDISRIVRIADSLYTVSDSEVQSHAYPSIASEGSVIFEAEAGGVEDVVY
ncbi:TPA: hypothetical protein DCL30_04420 [Candidatus Peribacteria bacterium]|nr:MAG: hypothetical protein A3J91_02210 [Candidatus Peribacteria bacterium RIFOXYC2_FULL_58_10]OGJ84023.1 MAG: hypothetical protein A2529_04475 [Candidatus Peribacteria bacterium RIFOXYD2_FULL_58_15]HAI98751.1 hypothetical protein [Candidatus Peribacteria bacterium]HAS34129.1 hypothetical protein [Candidatus Peribacteria bacterium]